MLFLFVEYLEKFLFIDADPELDNTEWKNRSESFSFEEHKSNDFIDF